jgi:uncharacterized protein (TIGR02266 family)
METRTQAQPQDATDAGPAVTERRQHRRVALETGVGFASDNNFYTGFMEDISEGGLFLATYELQPIGTVIDLTFTLPNDQVVEVVGEVRWVRDPRDEDPNAPPGMGIQFHELSEQARTSIHEFIAARAPIFYEE